MFQPGSHAHEWLVPIPPSCLSPHPSSLQVTAAPADLFFLRDGAERGEAVIDQTSRMWDYSQWTYSFTEKRQG